MSIQEQENESLTLDDTGNVQLPIVDILTGRAFICGKSGAGKSNSASVIAEELLDRGYPLLIVDTDGECDACGHLWRDKRGELWPFPYNTSDSVEDAPYNA